MLLLRTSVRHLRRHPWLSLLTVIGVAMGVAVVIAIDIANDSALRAFERSAHSLAGRTTHHILGGSEGLVESAYFQLRRTGWRQIAPVVEGYARLADGPARSVHILGIDPFAEGSFRNFGAQAGGRQRLRELLTQPGAALLTATTAASLGLGNGDTFSLEIAGRNHSATLVGEIAATAQDAAALDEVLLTDIATAQEWLGMVGKLTRIDVIAPEGADTSYWATRRALLPAEAQIVPLTSASAALAQMTSAFRTNLSAMSLLALVVGMFIIFNSMTFSVVRRRPLFGSLRALGVTRGEIWRMVMGEALVIACCASLLGVLLGVGLGQGLLALVGRTISDLYFAVAVTRVDVDAALVLKAIALGSGATLVAAALPALEATRTPPRAVMYRSDIETRVLRWVPLLRHFAYGGFALSALLLAWPSRSVTLSFAALFILVLSFALWSPTGVRVLTRWLRHFAAAGFGLFGSIAVNSVERNLSRTALAIAALMVCVATTFGVATMISSFRAAVSVWIGDTLRADLYVSKPATGYNPLTLALADEFIEHVAGLPEIDTLSLGRRATLVDTDTRTELLILEVPRRGFAGFRLREGNAETAWAAFSEGSGVLISEPYAYRHSLHVGDTVQLRAGAGEVRFPIAGVYTDYASEQGTVVMHRNTYRRHWGESLVTTLGVYLKPGADADAVMQRIRSLAAPDQSLLIRSNQAIREHTLQIFDQTFAITEVLRVLTILVACVGILTALMAVQLERAREFGVLRATGVTPAQLRITVIAETALMGLIAGILALPLGLLLSALLVFVINRRSFGWSMDLQFDLAQVGAALLLALVAATAAGIYPAEKMARSSPAAALRDE